MVVDMGAVEEDRDLLADLLTVLQTTEKDLPDVLKEITKAELTEGQVSRTTDLLLMDTGNHPRIIQEEMVVMMDIKDLLLALQETERVEIAMEIVKTEETEATTEEAADTTGTEATTELVATTEEASDTTEIEATTEVAADTKEAAVTTEEVATIAVGLRMKAIRKVALKNRNLKGTLPNQNLAQVHLINN